MPKTTEKCPSIAAYRREHVLPITMPWSGTDVCGHCGETRDRLFCPDCGAPYDLETEGCVDCGQERPEEEL
jgi:predicted amidophosphoribosyltransferase